MRHLILVLALLQTSWCQAQLVQQASPEQLIEKLAPPTTRSLRNLTPKPVTIDLMIQFDFDSANLQATSKPLLDTSGLRGTPMPKASPITTCNSPTGVRRRWWITWRLPRWHPPGFKRKAKEPPNP